MFFANKKTFIKYLYLIFFPGFLSGCVSSEKTAYEEFIESRENPLPGGQTVSREIAYLKNISQFEENNFQFITKQMKEVIKNYGRMKQKLSQIENKLERLFHQLALKEKTQERLFHQLALKEKTQESNEHESSYDDFVESGSEQNAQKQVESKNLLPDDVADNTGDIESENSLLIEEEITDDAVIFPK